MELKLEVNQQPAEVIQVGDLVFRRGAKTILGICMELREPEIIKTLGGAAASESPASMLIFPLLIQGFGVDQYKEYQPTMVALNEFDRLDPSTQVTLFNK